MLRRAAVADAVMATLIVCAFALASWAFYTGHGAGCARNARVLKVMSSILHDAAHQTASNHNLTADQRERAKNFYSVELARISKAGC